MIIDDMTNKKNLNDEKRDMQATDEVAGDGKAVAEKQSGNTVEKNNSRTRGLIPFKKGQSGNPKGRKPKTFQSIIKDLQAKGYMQVTKQMIFEAYQLLLSLDEVELKAMSQDITQPQTIRTVAKRMLSGEGAEIIERMLDRTHGKPAQFQNHSGDINLTLAGGLINIAKKKQKEES